MWRPARNGLRHRESGGQTEPGLTCLVGECDRDRPRSDSVDDDFRLGYQDVLVTSLVVGLVAVGESNFAGIARPARSSA